MEEERGVPLEFRVLGPLEVTRYGEALPFRGTREQALLALLVLNANRTVAAERLTEELWAGEPPEGAIRSLRVYVSRLRQALGPDGQAVVTRPSGYVLQVAPETVDAVRFEALVARGRDQARGGDHDRAARTFREALTLWRGPALANVADAPFARAEATRLEEARLAAVEDRIESDLACGRHGEVTAELEALTGEHPFRERLWSQRIIALYRSGRQADALRAYQQLRSTLAEQLGIEPSPALQQLEGAVLRHDPALDWHPPGERAATAPDRLPQPLVRKERLPLVGREVELSRLDQLWQATRSGQPQLVLVAGEPGIGKSRLSAEFARTAHGAEATVLFGRCDEGMGVPYQPFVEALGRYLRQAPNLVLGRLAGELVRLVPEVGERVQGLSPPLRSDPETERYRLFDAVAAWLSAASETEPVLFVVDDLHWATKPTLLLLSHLIRSDEDLRLLLVVTFRDTPLDMTADLSDLVVELLRQPGVERIRLPGLDETGVGALMEAQAGHALDDEGWTLARIVHGGTAGNPFYVREMLRHLAEKGDIARRDGRWVAGHPLAELDVPDSVRDVVERRLTRLPDRTSEMLALAAVLGERFDLALVVQASGETESSVVQTLGPAVSARLVEETDAGNYHFTHALVRSTLEDSLGPTRRQQLHRAAGLAVESVHASHLDAHLPELAHHFARARDMQKAIDYGYRSGDRALAQLAHDEAAAYYRQALELVDAADGPDAEARRCELLIALGEAQRRAGDPEHRQTLLDAAHLAQRLDNAAALARAALANNRGFFSVGEGVDAERVAVLEAALEGIGPTESALRARLLATLASEMAHSPDHQRRHALAAEALALAHRLSDRRTLGYVLALRWSSTWAPTTVQDRFDSMTELADLAEEVGDPTLTFWARNWGLVAAIEKGDAVAEDEVRLALDLAADLGQPTLQWMATFQWACWLLLAGRIDDAESQANEAYQIAQAAGEPDRFRFYGTQLFFVRFEQGRLEEVVGLVERGAHRSGASPVTRAALALALCELSRHDEARALVTELADGVFADAHSHYLSLFGLTMVAAAVAALKERTLAKPIYEQLLPHGAVIPHSGLAAIGCLHHHLGSLASVVGLFRDAEIHFAGAAATHERVGAPAWLARTRLEWARMLLTRRETGDADRAGELLGQALTAARELGLGNVERRAVELLT